MNVKAGLTLRYWHNVDPNGIHFTISDTGWGKALWGKLYGQWLSETCIFVYDFDRFDANKILPMFKKYNITTFCAPPTMYRFFIKEDLSKFDLSSIKYATVAGEALNPEVYNQFLNATGVKLMEGFGQTETTLSIGNFVGMTCHPGSMGKPSVLYDVDIVDPDGNPVKTGETGEIVIRTDKKVPADCSSATTAMRKRPRRYGMTGSTTPAIPHGRTRTATSGTSDVLTTLSSPPATVSDLSRSKALSWSFPMFWNAV